MDCRALAFRQLPHQPALFLAYLEKFEKAKNFYAHPPTIEAVSKTTHELDYPEESRAEVAAILHKQNAELGAGAETDANLGRLADGAAAGGLRQEGGVFGGAGEGRFKRRPP